MRHNTIFTGEFSCTSTNAPSGPKGKPTHASCINSLKNLASSTTWAIPRKLVWHSGKSSPGPSIKAPDSPPFAWQKYERPVFSGSEDVHSRYKDFAMVENAFQTCKTGHLELRPIYVRKADRTRTHVFVVMLSYLLTQELRKNWHGVDRTVEENLSDLSSLSGVKVQCQGAEGIYTIPRPRAELQRLFDLCGVAPPVILPAGQSCADTSQKLTCRRKSK